MHKFDKVRLSLQQELLDRVTPALRQVNLYQDGQIIILFFFYDGKPSETEEKFVSDIGAKMIANFPHHYIDWKIENISFPNKIDFSARVIFSRCEECLVSSACQLNSSIMQKVEDYSICLSLQRALLDRVTPALRLVSFSLEEETIKLVFFYDGKHSDDEEDLAGDIGAEMIADFPQCNFDCKLEDISFPNKIQSTGRIVYRRHE